jgi:hypothetical protein
VIKYKIINYVMNKKAFLFLCVFLSACLGLWAQSDEYIYFTIPGSPVSIVTLTVTMAAGESPTAYHIIDPSMSSTAPVPGNQILLDDTKYYPSSTAWPQTRATLSKSGSVLTLVIERWIDSTDRDTLAQGTWVLIVRNLNNPTTKSFACQDKNENPIATCASLNLAPTLTIGFNPPKSASFDSTYCFVTSSATQNISFTGGSVDPEGNALGGYRWESTNRMPAEFALVQNPVNISFNTDNSNAYDITFFVTESFPSTSFTRISTTKVTVVVKNPPVAAIQYNTTGAGDPYLDPPGSVLPVTRGDTLYFSGQNSQTNDPLAGGISYAWDFNGDGNAESSDAETFLQFSVDGYYLISLKVTDNYAYTAENSMSVFVSEDGSQIPALASPDLIAPANGSVAVALNTSFTWRDIEDEDTGHISYKLYVSQNNDFSGCTPIIIAGAVSAVHYASLALLLALAPFSFLSRRRLLARIMVIVFLGIICFSCAVGSSSGGSDNSDNINYTLAAPLASATQYFWKVRAENAGGDFSESQVWSFTTK